MTVADTIWVATKQLHRDKPDAQGFSRDEIDRTVREIDPTLKAATIHMHLTAHCLAWKPAQPSTLRMLSQNPDGTLRLFREGDPYHPSRHGGRTMPKPSVLVGDYQEFAEPPSGVGVGVNRFDPATDPLLALTGIGREMFARLGGGEAFIKALREDLFPPGEPMPITTERASARHAGAK